MLITLICWCIITFLALYAGIIINLLLNKFFGSDIARPDIIIIFGIMGLTVYAEMFSLFYKVGAVAVILLFVFAIIASIFSSVRKQIYLFIAALKSLFFDRYKMLRVIITVVLLLASLYVACGVETFYDTFLYHAQAIRWIEEYGVVRGLGLFHSRFAYNSAFMSLQALFGLKWLWGIELHSVNVYCALVLSMWSIHSLSLWKHQSFRPSDGLKCMLIIITWVFQLEFICSPNTDYLALSMVVYIIANLCDAIYACKENKDINPFSDSTLTGQFIVYSLLSVYAITLKLSVFMILFIAVYPAVVLIKNKSWKQILFAMVCSGIILFPYLARNIIISGYLIYPYSQIDLFNLPWKLNKGLLDYDRAEIIAYAKSFDYAELAYCPLSQWIPFWWSNVPLMWRRFMEVSSLFIAAAFFKCVTYLFRKEKTAYGNLLLMIYSISAAMLITWFFSAPLLRYGAVLILLIPGILMGDILSALTYNKTKIAITISYIELIVTVLISVGSYIHYLPSNQEYLMIPAPYQELNNQKSSFEGITVYYPNVGTDWVGYNDFPATPYKLNSEYLGIYDLHDLGKGFWNKKMQIEK